MMSPGALYRIFQREDSAAPSVRSLAVTLIIAAALLTAIGVIRVTRQHEVLRRGFELSRASELVSRLHETERQLELERATLAAPDRIRRLAVQLGMTPVSPDRIRVIHDHLRAADATPIAKAAP
ncbi:MAG TPA: cell division protein FtsL [Kofleriaceae bacterium]